MEPVAHLVRFHASKECTLGILYLEDSDLSEPPPRMSKIYATMEPPWLDNKPNISCIPAGTYNLQRYYSNKFQCELFEIVDVAKANLLDGRDGIAIHWGNKAHETQGCPLIGRGVLLDPPLLQFSKDAFQDFMRTLIGINSLPMRIEYV